MLQRQMKWLGCLLLFTTHLNVLATTINDEATKLLQEMVEKEQASSGLVSLGVAYRLQNASSRQMDSAVIAVAGERQIDSEVSVSAHDKWHLGSITKSMTATLLARLVERNVLQWQTTIGEVFKDDKINAAWRDVTLHMLLTHTSGAKANFPVSIQKLHPKEGPDRQSLRNQEVLKILAKKPKYSPGSDFEYSNVGYTIAGVMAAVKTGTSWEDLIRKELFHPLNLTSAGFGPPVDENEQLEQPRGHKGGWFSGPKAVSTDTDNSPIMAPAGAIHMSLADLTTFANEHLLGRQGNSDFLTQQTFAQLHKMTTHDYAYGWIAARKTAWVDHTEVLYHNGSNTYWYALLVMIPELKISIAVTTNHGDLGTASDSAWRLVKQIKAILQV